VAVHLPGATSHPMAALCASDQWRGEGAVHGMAVMFVQPNLQAEVAALKVALTQYNSTHNRCGT
jgi:hypothetical protein